MGQPQKNCLLVLPFYWCLQYYLLVDQYTLLNIQNRRHCLVCCCYTSYKELVEVWVGFVWMLSFSSTLWQFWHLYSIATTQRILAIALHMLLCRQCRNKTHNYPDDIRKTRIFFISQLIIDICCGSSRCSISFVYFDSFIYVYKGVDMCFQITTVLR